MVDIKNVISSLLTGPAAPDREYVIPGRTYGEVYETAAGILDACGSAGMSPGVPLCLCTEDKVLVAAAVLASLAGGPLLVIPYALSERGIRETAEAMGVRAGLADGAMPLPAGMRSVIPARGRWSKAAQPRGIDEPCLQLFTGGSTGKPKVWTKTPLNVVSEASFQAAKHGIRADDFFLATVPPYHIYGFLFSVMIPFVAGARVMDRVVVFPREILHALENNPVTVLASVPVHYRVLRGEDIHAPSLRRAFSSAGPLDRDDAAWFHAQTGVGVEEIFGSTETGGIACRCPAVGREILEPFSCVTWKIEDERLCVKSPFLSPDLPFDRAGFYMTGDRVEAAGSGFSLLGRSDGVVKVGGKRVDLNSVRDIIKRIPGVRDAHVFSLPGRKARDNDVAAVVEADTTEEKLKQALAGAVESYAMPRRLRVVEKLPSTSTGKIDREALLKLFAPGR
ncbi:MAG TPA: fatty acid--CoA ligase family protein [Spirochaetota bacterium]|nr:long-chain fatty acid--CoA ligase [Spirochaetota bacterium]HOD13122.1 fatty acid--CoA ligase family protein [Spirochaetota bacterium]HQL83233.1 fatty acid--CoA ligase family protein [Spirochaetota bacterium]